MFHASAVALADPVLEVDASRPAMPMPMSVAAPERQRKATLTGRIPWNSSSAPISASGT